MNERVKVAAVLPEREAILELAFSDDSQKDWLVVRASRIKRGRLGRGVTVYEATWIDRDNILSVTVTGVINDQKTISSVLAALLKELELTRTGKIEYRYQ